MLLSSLLDIFKKLFNICLNVDGEEISAVALVGLSIRTDQELLKVPGDIVSLDRTPNNKLGICHESRGFIGGEWKLFLEKLKQRVGIFSIHVHFLEELKIWFKAIPWTDIFQRLQDFIILAVLL